MVKYFSVDWLSQSHHDSNTQPEESQTDTTFKPHVPCMVQPRAPAFGKGYLQRKPKAVKNVDVEKEGLFSPSSSCASPSKFTTQSCLTMNLKHITRLLFVNAVFQPVFPLIVSETSGYSSGYESEAASSECLSLNESEAEKDAQHQRRVRTKFSPEQINKLEKIFLKHKYLDSAERLKTAHKLHLTETQVRTWFQNRRMKLKRAVQDYLTPQVPAALLHALPPALHKAHYPHPAAPAPAPGFYPLPVALMQQHQIIPSLQFY